MQQILKQGSYVRSTDGAPNDNRIVTFFRDSVYDEQASNQAGRALYKDVEMVEIRFPGNQLNIPQFPVNDMHRQMYAAQYEKFLASEEQASEGTPIESLLNLSKAMVKELKYLDIHTVEQAAGLSDYNVQQLPAWGSRLRTLSQKYLEQAAGLAPLAKMTAENEELKERVQEQEGQLAQMNEMLRGMQAQLNALAQAPQRPIDVFPGAPDPHGIGSQAAPAVSALDSLGAETPKPPRRGRPPKVAAHG